jgi:hypothetical protein
MGELAPQNNTELVVKNGNLYGNYDGVVFYQGSDASIGIGTGIDAKTLASAERGEISQEAVRFDRRLFNGLAAANLLFQGGLAAVAPFVGESPVSNLISCVTMTAAAHGMSYIEPRRAKKRHQAIMAMSEQLIHIPSNDLSVDLEGLPEHTSLVGGPVPTSELVDILQKMQTSHLPQEAASIFEADHQDTINPAMVIKGGLLGLAPEHRGAFIHTVFDRAQATHDLTTSLHRHAPLAVTEQGREALRAQTTSILGHLGEIATSFVDLKAAETAPRVENLIDVADNPQIRAGLEDAKQLLGDTILSLPRYELATRNWGDAGTL